MAALTFNTLKFANRLKKAGVPIEQAEAEAEALAEVFEANSGELVTKGDLKQEFRALRQGIDTKLAELKFELIKWIIGLSLTQFALLVGIIIKLTLSSGVH